MAFRSLVECVGRRAKVALPAGTLSSTLVSHSRMMMSTSASSKLVDIQDLHGVRTIRMNNPRKLNSWTVPMMNALFDKAFVDASLDSDVKAVILTGSGDYYCAGVDLKSLIKPMLPRTLMQLIETKNKELFENFLRFEKPIIAAVNGHAIGASATSATLCDAVVASDSKATFSTPFAALGLPPEGCSSIFFEELMGSHAAKRMLEDEGWRPTATEAKEIGLVDLVVDSNELLTEAQQLAEGWIDKGKPREVKGRPIAKVLPQLLEVNAKESRELAEAVLSRKFLDAQSEFLSSRNKHGPARIMRVLSATRFAWGTML